MKTNYLVVEQEVIEARRRLNRLQGVRLGLTLSASLTLVYLILFFFGWVQLIQPWPILILFNAICGGLGMMWGDRRPTRLQHDLLRVDRALGLGEKLTTIFELRRGERSSDILEALYRRIDQSHVDPKEVFKLPRTEQNGWYALGGITAGILLMIGLWGNGLSLLHIEQWLQGLPINELSSQQTLLGKDALDGSQSVLGKGQNQSNAKDKKSDDAACEKQDSSSTALSSDANCVNGRDQNSPTDSQNQTAKNQNGQNMPPNFPQSLSDLLQQLQQGNISQDEVQKDLSSLANQLPPGLLQDMLKDAAKSMDPADLAKRLADALKEAQRQDENQKKRAQSNDKNDNQPSPQGGPGSKGQGIPGMASGDQLANQNQNNSNKSGTEAPNSGSSSSQSGENPDQPKGGDQSNQSGQAGGKQGSSDSLSQNGKSKNDSPDKKDENGKSSDGSGTNDGSNNSGSSSGSPESSSDDEGSGGKDSSGGNGAGDTAGNGKDGKKDQSLTMDKSLLIHGASLPQDAEQLKRLITLGLPVDLQGTQADGTPTLKLNIERVESLLQLRELPPNLRALVRAYFLAIAGEKSSK
ncbi:hypothetical protein HY229_04155 [Candidatus Acetothermia bacterium]|nr:hypothetical protein [Candidatus Acetothermia bacterium]MBI3643277.1 hypothetical protein [Candidatus Acetothermia bacterium]